MKKFLTLFVVLAMLIVSMSIPVSAATMEDAEPEASVQPRLNTTVTVALGNTWTDIYVENNWFKDTLNVFNHTTSIYDVDIRIISTDHKSTLKGSQTIESGSSGTFYSIPSGGYIIQGKATDGIPHEYTLSLED